MTDVPPPDSPKPPRGRPRRPKGYEDEAVLSEEEVARRVDVRGGGTPRGPIERAPVRAPRTPPRRPEKTGARDSLLLIGLVIVGLVAVRLFLPDGPLTASATATPGGSQAAVTTASPQATQVGAPTGGLITLPPTAFVPTASPAAITEPPITPAPIPTPTLRPGQTPAPTPKPTPKPTTGPTPPGTAHVTVVINVINGNGGSAAASAWSVDATSAGTATPSSFSGSASGTSVAISAGVAYSIASSGPDGYAKSVSANCSSTTGGLPLANQTETCTIVVNDIAPKITVFTEVDNTGGGTLSPSDITVSVSGTHVAPSTSFAGSSAGIAVTIDAGTSYAITMSSAPTDYDKSGASAGCDGSSLALGATATCTITYTYDPPPPPPTESPAAPGLLLPLLALPWRPRRWRSIRAA